MLLRTASALLMSVAGVWAAEGPAVANSLAAVRAVGAPGRYTGFDVLSLTGGRPAAVAEVRWTSAERWTCARCDVSPDSLRFSGFDTSATGTPVLRAETAVTVALADGDPFPRVSFRLAAEAFDAGVWRRAWQHACPLYFLRLSLPAGTDPGQLFYQGGELYPGPEVDPFPITMPPMRGDWSPRWSYAPALGAAPIPAIGLWAPASRLFAGYEFQESRLTDQSDTFLASSYCAGLPDHPGQFLSLSYPHAAQWLNLRLPEGPFDIGTSFRLLYHAAMPSDSDPNRFVIRHLLGRYRDSLPPAPRMNDMSWLRQGPDVSQRLFLHDLGLAKDYPRAGVAGHLWFPYEKCEKAFFDPGAVQLAAHQSGKSARLAWVVQDSAGLAELKKQLDYLAPRARTERFGEDVCHVWEHPLEGHFKQIFGGPPAKGTRHMFNWGIASAMLWFYRQEQTASYLPFLDGMVRWTRHYLYDRAGMADLPWAVFSMGAANGGEFLLDYYYTFRDDPERRALAEEAWRLAEVVVYRNIYYYTADPDAADTLDPTFLLQAVNSHYWLGQVTWGEMGRIPEMAIQMYLETGDPFFRYLVRGCLERFYLGTIDTQGNYTENLSIFGETGKKGATSGGWGANNFRWLAEPLGGAVLQVDVGPRGAMAFCRGTRAVDIADYAFAPEACYAFTLTVDEALPGAPAGPFDIMVTSPRRSLAGTSVAVNGQTLPRERFVVGTAGTDLYLRGVRRGDRVVISPPDARPVPVPMPELPVRTAFSQDRSGRFAAVDLTRDAGVRIDDTWGGEWGGLIPGRMAAAHVRFCLIDPTANGGRGAVSLENGFAVDLPEGACPLAVVLGAPHPLPEDAECARATLSLANGAVEEIALSPADGVLVQQGMEWYGKDWWLRVFPLGRDGAPVRTLRLSGPALLFAVSVPTPAAAADAARLRAEVDHRRLMALRERQRQAYQLYQTPAAAAPIESPWLDEAYPYRFLVRLDPIVTPRRNAIVRVKERLDLLLRQVGIEEEPDPATVRAVALDDQGAPAGAIPAQFSPRGGPAGRGELLLRLPGEWTAPRWVAVYFGTAARKAPRASPSPRLTLQQEAETLRASSGKARIVFRLDGAGPAPRLMELSFGDGPNLLARAGWDEGFGHLCACQDGVTWYDFGALQKTPATAQVIDHGPLALTVRVTGLEIYGAGGAVPLDRVGTQGRTAAAVKGRADWYFRLYEDDERVDSWLEYTITDPDTHWTRPMEVRYGLAVRTGGRTGDRNRTGAPWASQGALCLVGLDEEGDAPAVPYYSEGDGSVLGVHFAKPAFPAVYRSDKWRSLPAGLDEDAIAAEAAPVGIEQYALEIRRDNRTERPSPQPVETEGPDGETDYTRAWTDPASLAFQAGQPDIVRGLANRDNPDEGTSLRERVQGRWCVVPGKDPRGGPQHFVYFALASPPAAPAQGLRAFILVEYFDRGSGSATLEYDSVDPSVRKSDAPGAFKEASEKLSLGNSREWRTQVFLCPDAKFARRCNGADFRLNLGSGSLAVSRVAVVWADAVGTP